jgi:hypothetical protein
VLNSATSNRKAIQVFHLCAGLKQTLKCKVKSYEISVFHKPNLMFAKLLKVFLLANGMQQMGNGEQHTFKGRVYF